MYIEAGEMELDWEQDFKTAENYKFHWKSLDLSVLSFFAISLSSYVTTDCQLWFDICVVDFPSQLQVQVLYEL